jgi:hypothetical protein
MGSFSLSGGVEVIGFISPTDPLDEYPVIDPLYGIDGFRNVDLITDLDNIPDLRRRAGMVVGVSGGTKYYKLKQEPWVGDITDWDDFTTSSTFTGGTVTGDTIFTQGVTATTFSASTYLGLPLDVYVTGGTYSNGTIVFTNNSGSTFDVSGLYTGETDDNQYVTGFTYNNNTFTISDNSGNTFNATINTVTGLTVNGNTIISSGLTANTISASTISAPGSTTQVIFNNGGVLGANSGFVYSGSSVGIGTTTPSGQLQVGNYVSNQNGIQINQGVINLSKFGQIQLSSIYGNYYGLIIKGNTANVLSLYSGIGGNDSNRFSGGVVGTTINDGASIRNVLDNGTGGAIFMDNVAIGLSGTTAKLHINNTTSGNTFLAEDSSNPDSSPFVIDASGNTGIGTTTPGAKLDVRAQGGLSTDIAFRVRNSGDTGNLFAVRGNSNIVIGDETLVDRDIIYSSNRFIRFQNNGLNVTNWFASAPPVDVLSSHKFGFNNNSLFELKGDSSLHIGLPGINQFSMALRVNSTQNILEGFRNAFGTNVKELRIRTGEPFTTGGIPYNSGNIVLQTGSGFNGGLNGDIIFQISSGLTEVSRITSTGLGIGTSSPSEKLDVSGKTKTINLQVTSGATTGYVLTSDSSGNATWQIPTTFTGGTGSCITELYIENLHSCTTGITLHNDITPSIDNTINFGTQLKRFRDINTVSGTTTVWTATTSVYTPNLDLGLDGLGNSRIITANNSVIQNDTLNGGIF